MKSIYLLAVCALISIASLAQKNEEHKDKDERTPRNSHSDQVTHHEKVIWAGTGVDLNDKSRDVKNVPDAVLASFRQFFPNQRIDNVRKYHGMYAITFSNEVYTTTMVYKADGTFVEARTVATDSILPSAVKDELHGKNKEYDPNEIVMIEKANKEKFYRVHLKNDQKDEYEVYDEHGRRANYDY